MFKRKNIGENDLSTAGLVLCLYKCHFISLSISIIVSVEW